MAPELLIGLLAVAGLLIGATGTWSPCGLSMIETVGPSGHCGGRRTTAAALTTFVPGAVIGGAVTYGGLAWIGSLLHGGAGGTVLYSVAAVIAVGAGWAELRGLPIVPQVRRQLPEHWRRVMPMPLAAGLYGMLLGLGFTTFVLSFGVWALAAISVVIGNVAAGVVLGVAFGVGRAVPIAVLAPLSKSRIGIEARDRMTQSPTLYRRFRTADGLALGAVALGMLAAGPVATAASVFTGGAGDPDVSGGEVVVQRDHEAAALIEGEPLGGGGALIHRGGEWRSLAGSVPAIGGPYIALRRGDSVAILDRDSLTELDRVRAPRTDAAAVNGQWLIERQRRPGGDRLQARRLGGASDVVEAGRPTVIFRMRSPGQIGPPSITGHRVFFPISSTSASRIATHSLTERNTRFILGARRAALTGIDVLGRFAAYVRTTNEWQTVRLRRLDTGAERILHRRPATSRRDPDHERGRTRLPTMDRPPHVRRDPWMLNSIALAPKAVYATLLTHRRTGVPKSRLIRISRG